MYTAYLNRDNSFTVQLKVDGAIHTLGGVTNVALRFMGVTYDYTGDNDAFDFVSGSATGEIEIWLGTYTGMTVGRDPNAELIIYDATWTNGLVWGTIDVRVVDVA